jgi:catalase
MSTAHRIPTRSGYTPFNMSICAALIVLSHTAIAERRPPSATPGNAAATSAIVDALKTNAGNPKGVRASFAKGQCIRGRYEPAPEVSRVTRSLSFTQPSEVLGRFAVGGGNPHVADTTKAVLRGFSFRLGQSEHTTDLLFQNAPVHFARSVDQMLGFLKARTPGADGKPDHDRVKAFSDANPETLNQANFLAARPLPGSFVGTTYWAVHAFPATNARGKTRFIKLMVVPAAGEITLTEEQAKAMPADFLVDDLLRRIADQTARFDLVALLDRPHDPTMDVTQRWPDEDQREAVRLGTLTITALTATAHCDESIFNPAKLAPGLGQPPDEMFAARASAYAISLARRRGEGRQ